MESKKLNITMESKTKKDRPTIGQTKPISSRRSPTCFKKLNITMITKSKKKLNIISVQGFLNHLRTISVRYPLM
jgi:hypothetical protein